MDVIGSTEGLQGGAGAPVKARGRNFCVSLAYGAVSVTGELDVATAARFDRALVDIESRLGADPLTIDLRDLDFMGAAGIAVLVAAGERARTAGRLLIVIAGTGAPARALRLCGLDLAASPFTWPTDIAYGSRSLLHRGTRRLDAARRMAS